MMDILSWTGWLIWSLLALLWSVVWLLLGGWISTFAQIVVVVMAIYVYRYGWRNAAGELFRQGRAVWRFASGAMRASEALAEADSDRKRDAVKASAAHRDGRRSILPPGPRHAGDVTINLSTALTIAAMTGLLWLSLL